MPDPIPDSLLSLAELLLDAQIKAIRKVRQSPASAGVAGSAPPRRRGAPRKGNSQLDIVYNLLKSAGGPLHISEIVARGAAAGFALDRDSVVSALTKRIQHSDRFRRTAPNTFALLMEEGPTS
jgi:hypothetical protein